VITCIGGLVARINRTRHPVCTIRWCARLAAVGWMTSLNAVAELPVVAGGVVGRVQTPVLALVARINRTRHPICTIRQCPRLATVGRMTCLRAVAKQAIVARRIIGDV